MYIVWLCVIIELFQLNVTLIKIVLFFVDCYFQLCSIEAQINILDRFHNILVTFSF